MESHSVKKVPKGDKKTKRHKAGWREEKRHMRCFAHGPVLFFLLVLLQGKSEGKEEEHGKAYFRLRMFGLLAEKLFCLFSSLAGLWWCGVIGEASPYEVRSRVWQPLSLSLFQLITAVENKV